MTDTTATQGLLRTQLTDDHKKMDVYLGTLARQVDQRISTQLFNQRRARLRPFAILEVGTEVLYDSNAVPNEIVFDTIGEDTDGMADLSVNPSVISLTSPGFWAVGGYVHTTGFGAAASDTQMNINVSGGGGFTAGSVRDQAIALAATSASFLLRMATPNAFKVFADITWNGASTSSVTTLRYAQLWAYKVRDL